jgi:hypothetical protein
MSLPEISLIKPKYAAKNYEKIVIANYFTS